MHLHPSLSHQMSVARDLEARGDAERVRLARAARCADQRPGPRARRHGCPELVTA